MLRMMHYFIEDLKLSSPLPLSKQQETQTRKLTTSVTPCFFKLANDTKKLKVTLDINVKIEEYEFNLELKISGFFEVDTEVEIDKVTLSTPDILLNTARDIITTVTSKTIYGPICLPICSCNIE